MIIQNKKLKIERIYKVDKFNYGRIQYLEEKKMNSKSTYYNPSNQ